MSNIKIIKYNPKILPQILKFIKKSKMTKRTKSTWIKNNMTSVNIKDGNKIIGVLPFEKIYIKINNKFEKVLWISALFVLPEYRNKKFATQILQFSEKIFIKKIKYIFVVREDYGSKAYRWYKKNGFKIISKILSYEKKISKSIIKPNYELLDNFNSFRKKGSILNKTFERLNKSYNGYKKRDSKFWFNLKNHYYNQEYKFKILILRDFENKYHYALVGKTKMRDNCLRLEILEFCSNNLVYKKLLLNSIVHLAKKESCKKIRIKISIFDKIQDFLKKNKFKKNWETYILAKNLNKKNVHLDKYKFFQTESI
jgi:ribosomal protein S18 acetylase RimI-like enzyme